MELQEAFDVGFEEVKRYVDDIVDGFEKRLAAVEARHPAAGEDGKDGRDGKDGTSVTLDDVAPLIRAEVAKAVEAIPVPQDGKDGRDGIDGASFTIEDVAPLIEESVAKAVSALPTPKDGRDGIDGKDGEPGRDGMDGKDGAPGLDGKDGVSLAGAMIDRDGVLVLTLSNGEHKMLGRVVGRDGAPGKDGEPGEKGRDGFSLKDFDTELLDDGQTVLLKFGSGDTLETHELFFPVTVYRGVWQEGSYTKGSSVSWGGSSWVAQRNTSDKPETSDAWRLAVKRGRDGKDAK